MINIIYAQKDLIPSFYECLKSIASERIYLEMVTPPPLEKVIEFQTKLIDAGGPVYYAVENNKVIGWCDIFPLENPRQKHRGSMGMGILKDFRGNGLGTQLLEKTLQKAKIFGLEKIELHVYTTNINAIALYKKLGFEQEGYVKHYRKLDDQYFDSLAMAKFL